jgi:transposase
MVEFKKQGTTIISEMYCKTLKNCVGPSGAVLLHDNERLHSTARIQALLEHFNWELFDCLPYSPDLTPNDYYLFTYLKNW